MNENLDIDQVVRRVNGSDGKHLGYMIFCPACETGHLFDSRWTFNNNYMKPTFKPSMLVNKNLSKPKKYESGHVSHRCHSFVTDGVMRFLGDCTHYMKNTSADLEVF